LMYGSYFYLFTAFALKRYRTQKEKGSLSQESSVQSDTKKTQ